MSDFRVSPELRKRIALEGKYRCGYCLTSELLTGTALELDHILPRSLGGSTEESNL